MMEVPVIIGFDIRIVAMFIAGLYSIFNSIFILMYINKERRSKLCTLFTATAGIIFPAMSVFGTSRWFSLGHSTYLPFADQLFWSFFHLLLLLFFAIKTSSCLHALIKLRK